MADGAGAAAEPGAAKSVLPPVRRGAAHARRRGPASAQTRLVGREAELGLLREELRRAGAGELRAVLVSGEAGVGKTRLVREFVEGAPAGTIGLSARGYPAGSTVAYGLWVDALEALLAPLGADDVREVCGEFLDDLATILHRVASVRGGAPPDRPRPRLAEGLVRVLDDLSLRATVVVVLDDLHLSDPSSWEALRRLARQLPARPVLLVGTARPAELAAAEVAAHVLFELEQDGLLSRVELKPLAVSGVADLAAALLDRPPPPRLVHWLYERSEGNPLYAQGLLRALLDEGADLHAPRLRRLPEGLVERVRSRTGSFTEGRQRILEIVAVTGRPVTLGELEALAGRRAEDMAGDIEELVAVRALVEDERGRDLKYALSHSLVRDAVYLDIGGARRRLLHRQVARALAAAGRLAEAAAHFARSAEVGDPEAIDVLLRAVSEAERREAYREALALIAELVELLPEGDGRWHVVADAVTWDADWVVDHRADSHGAVGVRAMRAIDAAFARAVEPVGRRAAVKFRLASFLAWGTGELEEAAAVSREATCLFAEAGDRRSELLSAREEAFVAGLQGDLESMVRQARLVVEAAEAEGLRFVAMQAHHALGFATGFLGRTEESASAAERAIQIAIDDGKVYRATTALVMLAWARAAEGRIDEARSCLARGRALNPAFRDSVLVEQEATISWVGGDARGALDSAMEAVAWAPAGSSLRRVFGVAAGAIAAVEADRPREAVELLDRAERAVAGREWWVCLSLTRAARGMWEWQANGPAAGLPALVLAADGLMAKSALTLASAACLEAADAAAEAGNSGVLHAMRAHLARLAGSLGGHGHAGLLAWADGRAALLREDRHAAAAAAREAVGRLELTQWEGRLARALHLLGRAAGPGAEAVAALERAAGLYERNGANWRRGHVLDDLRVLGGAGRRAAAAALGPASLSPREREVAGLAAGGLSTRQIAERLVLSERTVETHLSRAYAKLGVSSRVALARRAAELGLYG